MRFRSPTSQAMQIGLTSGHTAVITHEGNELPAMFHREAIARGAVPLGIESAAVEHQSASTANSHGTAVVTADRNQAIQLALQQMLDGGDEGDFNDDGKPNLTKLKTRVGFAITREEADAAWGIVSAPDSVD